MTVTRRPPTAFILSAPLLAGLALLEPLVDERAPQQAAPAPMPVVERLSELDAAAEAVRRRDYAAARRLIGPLIRDEDASVATEAAVLLGLYAHASGELVEAHELLVGADGYGGGLADWRLWALADSQESLELPEAAAESWARLLGDHRESPLRADALARAAELAATRGDRRRALEIIGQALELARDPERILGLERTAWRISGELADGEERRRVARRLLVEHPLEASKLGVIELLRRPDGRIEWPVWFSTDDLLRRARRLLESDVPKGALEALMAIAPADRTIDWYLLAAEARIASHRGKDALDALGALPPPADPADRARYEWLQARAALEAASLRRDRPNLGSELRRAMRERAREHLWRVASAEVDPQLAVAALRRLFGLLEPDADFAETRRIVAALRAADPADTSGAAHLWRLGWGEFEARNPTGAIGTWRELATLYPGTSYARSGLYWSARAHETLGNSERAQEILLEIAAIEYNDFYRRHALARLEVPAPPIEPAAVRGTLPWPTDDRLRRVRLLTDLGLDAAAHLELGVLGPTSDRRAHRALEAIVLARLGQRRGSIQSLWQAFPMLGTPGQGAAPETALRMYYPLDFREVIERRAEDQGLSPHLVLAMVRQESAFDSTARSHAGARGLMQLMPTTGQELARRLGLPFDQARLSEPDYSLRLGTAYFRQVLSMFGGNEELALAGYNGGPYRIRKLWQRAAGHGEIDRFVEGLQLSETRTYVKRVLLLADSYRRLYG